LIIARNESENIQSCLKSICNNKNKEYAIEIILVDDHSDDDTIEASLSLQIPELRILELKDFDRRESYGKAFKKAGLHFGLREATYSTILTTVKIFEF